jgi:putative protein kinase ArgK-like GTPase of G3E family
MKAGLMEIGDIFGINKTDRKGQMWAVALRTMLHLEKESDDWETSCKTIGLQNKG